LKQAAFDRLTRELIAMTVALLHNCDYCALAHEALAGLTALKSD
jgi:AhpD family alkylhydroperoxidase